MQGLGAWPSGRCQVAANAKMARRIASTKPRVPSTALPEVGDLKMKPIELAETMYKSLPSGQAPDDMIAACIGLAIQLAGAVQFDGVAGKITIDNLSEVLTAGLVGFENNRNPYPELAMFSP